MTQKEYEKVCAIISKHIKTQWISTNYQKQFIDIHGVTLIKEELKQLVKEQA